MQIVLRGAAAGYEAEHTARIFYPAAELSQTLPDDTAALVLAVAHRYLLLVLVRQTGTRGMPARRSMLCAACCTPCCAALPVSARPGA